MDVLDQIMGVEEAGKLWGYSPDHIKRLCRDGKIKAKKIGKTWVIDKNQPNPKEEKKMIEKHLNAAIEGKSSITEKGLKDFFGIDSKGGKTK